MRRFRGQELLQGNALDSAIDKEMNNAAQAAKEAAGQSPLRNGDSGQQGASVPAAPEADAQDRSPKGDEGAASTVHPPASSALVLYATVRDGGDEWHIECRMIDGQKGAVVTVDHDYEHLAHQIAAMLSAAPASGPSDFAVQCAKYAICENGEVWQEEKILAMAREILRLAGEKP